ncbi:MAG: DNA gyrase inhibitor YacG [Paracidovorax wautersii]|uniref:DNA gyrase inhibitor YacG n=1 Tax=Paracidovorax wautersii TaxID=1177982 RepID=A0A7V8JQV9_9BURK|nr:MAG: DNA gyrase inhibitor YacG [Paracidovorax wautersii]
MSVSMSSKSKTPNTPPMAAGPEVPCPTCGNTTVYAPSNPYRPFCSERCKGIDLGAWANEQFRVDAIEPPDDEDGGRPGGAGSAPASADWRH